MLHVPAPPPLTLHKTPPPPPPPHLQCLYYLAEKVGDDSVLTVIPEVPRADSLVSEMRACFII